MSSDPVVITSFARTPKGGMLGSLSAVKATDLGAAAITAAIERAGIAPERIDRVYMGCVLAAALGQAPARQAALAAGLPHSAQASTVNKMCGSGSRRQSWRTRRSSQAPRRSLSRAAWRS